MMKKRLALIFLASSSFASAGDWAGSFLQSLGDFYPSTRYLDRSDGTRWALGACDQFGAFLAGRYGIKDMRDVRVFTFAGPITEPQFWKSTGRLKREPVNFHFGKGRVILVKAETRPYPFQELAESKNFKGAKFFVGLGNASYKPVLCTVTFYE